MFDTLDRMHSMDPQQDPSMAPKPQGRDADLAKVAAENRAALGPNINYGARPQQQNRAASQVAQAMQQQPRADVAMFSGAPDGQPAVAAPPPTKPQGAPPPTSGNLTMPMPVGNPLDRLRTSTGVAPVRQPLARPVAAPPVQRSNIASLNLNPRSFQNAQIVAGPRNPAPATPMVAPRAAPLAPPAAPVTTATPLNPTAYYQGNTDLQDAYGKYQAGNLTPDQQMWWNNIPAEARANPEAFATWHYNNYGKTENRSPVAGGFLT